MGFRAFQCHQWTMRFKCCLMVHWPSNSDKHRKNYTQDTHLIIGMYLFCNKHATQNCFSGQEYCLSVRKLMRLQYSYLGCQSDLFVKLLAKQSTTNRKAFIIIIRIRRSPKAITCYEYITTEVTQCWNKEGRARHSNNAAP
jgi:hypothetical protein